MKRLLIPAAVVAAGGVLAACGSGSSSANSPSTSTPAGNAMTVSVKQVDGVGRVLVDGSGKVLYSSDQEADGKVRCDGACTSFWTPLAPGAGSTGPTSQVANLGVIQRPDGKMQVTENGKPLYSFNLDSPGSTKGDNFSDDFGGQHFTWHAVHAAGPASGAPATTTNGGGSGGGGSGGGNPSTTSPSGAGGGYGY
jgi:predicted lipoprotein with Yx(FWY)xxD motif